MYGFSSKIKRIKSGICNLTLAVGAIILVKLNTFSDLLQQKCVIVSIKDTGKPKTLGVICFLVHYHNFVL